MLSALLTTNLILISITLYTSLKKNRAGFFSLSVGLFVYLTLAPILYDNYLPITPSQDSILKGTALCTVMFAIIGFFVLGAPTVPIPKLTQVSYCHKIITPTLICSVLGIFFYLLEFYLRGGFHNVWSRDWDSSRLEYGNYLITIPGSAALLYSYLILYLFIIGENVKKRHYCAALVIFALFLISSLFMGVTSRPMCILMPIGIIYVVTPRLKSGDNPMLRLIVILIAGLIAVTGYRAARLYGEISHAGSEKVSTTDLFNSFNSSDVSTNKSFNEYYAFCYVIDKIDSGSSKLDGASYLLPFECLIPGSLWKDKNEVIYNNRPDYIFSYRFLPANRNLELIPSGFYGEAYFNFAVFGVIIFIMILCYVIYRLENIASLALIPGPLVMPLIGSGLIFACRLYVNEPIYVAVDPIAVWSLSIFIYKYLTIDKFKLATRPPADRHVTN